MQETVNMAGIRSLVLVHWFDIQLLPAPFRALGEAQQRSAAVGDA